MRARRAPCCRWEVKRRWTELRITIDALKATHSPVFACDGVPSFEPHAWWRLGPAALDPKFLTERAQSMQSIGTPRSADRHHIHARLQTV